MMKNADPPSPADARRSELPAAVLLRLDALATERLRRSREDEPDVEHVRARGQQPPDSRPRARVPDYIDWHALIYTV